MPCSPAAWSARSRPVFFSDSSPPAPAALELEPLEALPPAALEDLEASTLGHEQFALGVFTEPLTDVSPTLPWTLVCSGQEHAADDPPAAALPLTLDPEAAAGAEVLLDEDEEPDGIVPPAAELVLGEVEPEALPEPEDWLVCAP